jgi:hypothetical protein
MNSATFACEIHFQRHDRGAKALQPGPSRPRGRVPRVSRLMALALHVDGLLRQGTLTDYAEVARLGQVTRARVSQIMNLLNLAPDLQEALLFLPPTLRGRDPVILRDLQPIASTLDWRRQRLLWQQLQRAASRRPTAT